MCCRWSGFRPEPSDSAPPPGPVTQVANLNVLSLVNAHAAAALQYGIDRSYENRTENVIFYDVGSSSVEVSPKPESFLSSTAPSMSSSVTSAASTRAIRF